MHYTCPTFKLFDLRKKVETRKSHIFVLQHIKNGIEMKTFVPQNYYNFSNATNEKVRSLSKQPMKVEIFCASKCVHFFYKNVLGIRNFRACQYGPLKHYQDNLVPTSMPTQYQSDWKHDIEMASVKMALNFSNGALY